MDEKIVFKVSIFLQRDDRVSKLNSTWSFCCRVPIGEKCLELRLRVAEQKQEGKSGLGFKANSFLPSIFRYFVDQDGPKGEPLENQF